MPIFRLSDELHFPDVSLAEPDGLLAVGGDLSPERLVAAYSAGIFPWFSDDSPLLWWSPDPRMVLLPSELRVSRSLRRTLRKGTYRVTCDQHFEQVIRACAVVGRGGQEGTWITDEMTDAYLRLHRMGVAHCVEAWLGDELVGGLYGVGLGGVFFGESMFHLAPDASKVAFVTLVETLAQWGFTLIDCQVYTQHLERFGARLLPRPVFLARLQSGLAMPQPKGQWVLNPAA